MSSNIDLSGIAAIVTGSLSAIAMLHWVFMKFLVTPAIKESIDKNMGPMCRKVTKIESGLQIIEYKLQARTEEGNRIHDELKQEAGELWEAVNDLRGVK